MGASESGSEWRRLRLHGVLALLMALVPVVFFGVQHFWSDRLYWLGVLPRTAVGVVGIFTGVLVHASWSHLVSNALPLLVLGFCVWHFYPGRALRVVSVGWLGSGLGTWLIGRDSYHLGASGLVYALAAYVVTRGFAEGQRRLAAVSLLVIFLYGSMVWGLFPHDPGVSWEGHLSGAFFGVLLGLSEPRDGARACRGVGGTETHCFSEPMHSGHPRGRIVYRRGGAVKQKD